MKIRLLIFISLFLGIQSISIATESDSLITYYAQLIDQQIDSNAYYIESGQADKVNYIVDARFEVFKQIHPLSVEERDALNLKLKTFHDNSTVKSKNSEVVLYVLYTTKQPTLFDTDSYQDFDDYLKYVKGISPQDWKDLDNSNKPTDKARYNKIWDDYKKQNSSATQLIFERSKLGANNDKGALLHMYSSTLVGPRQVNSKSNWILKYTPVVALGEELKGSSVKVLVAEIRRMALGVNEISTAKRLYHATDDNAGVTNPYVTKLINIFNKYIANPDFFKDESGVNLDARTVIWNVKYSTSSYLQQHDTKLDDFNYNVKAVQSGNFVIRDYAGLLKCSPTFLTLIKNYGDLNGIKINSLSDDEDIKYVIIVTSDVNKYHLKSAVQLAYEETYNNTYGYAMIIGIHVDQSRSNDGEKIYSQTVAIMSSNLQKLLASKRDDMDYAWYSNKVTKRKVYGKSLSFDSQYEPTNWVYLGKYVHNDNGKCVYSNDPKDVRTLWGSVTYVDHQFDALDNYMRENGEVISEVVVEGAICIALAIPSGGTSVVGFVGLQVSKQAAKKAATAAAVNAVLQVTINYYFKDVGSLSAAFSQIDKTDVAVSAVEEFLTNPVAKAVLNCGGGMVNYLDDNDGKTIDGLKLTESCMREVAIYYISEGASAAGGKAIGKFVLWVKESPGNKVKFIAALKKYFKKSDSEIDDILEKFGILQGAGNILEKYRVAIFDRVKIIAKDESLPQFIKESFLDNYYYTAEALENVGVFRRFGGSANQAKLFGGFSSTEAVLGRNELAILKKWSTMQFEAELIVEKGAKLNLGKIAPQSVYSGGADQVLLPLGYPENWVKSVKDLKTGTVYSLEELKVAFPDQIK